MKNKALNEVQDFLKERWGSNLSIQIRRLAEEELVWLCEENEEDRKAVYKHKEKNILPCISLYRALQKCGVSREEALEFLDESWSRKTKPGAEKMKKILGFAGLYKLYPAMFQIVAKKQYGVAAGFQAQFYRMGKQHCKFDMTKCLFVDTCEKYGCPELTKCFCHVDDINNKELHPKLCWNRTQYMGNGDEYCDFDIFVNDNRN